MTNPKKEADLVASIIHSQGIVGSCLYVSAILHKRFMKKGIDHKIVDGFAVVSGRAFRHLWIELEDGGAIDGGYLLMLKMCPELERHPYRLSKELAKDLPRIDNGTRKKKKELALLNEAIKLLMRDGFEEFEANMVKAYDKRAIELYQTLTR